MSFPFYISFSSNVYNCACDFFCCLIVLFSDRVSVCQADSWPLLPYPRVLELQACASYHCSDLLSDLCVVGVFDCDRAYLLAQVGLILEKIWPWKCRSHLNHL